MGHGRLPEGLAPRPPSTLPNPSFERPSGPRRGRPESVLTLFPGSPLAQTKLRRFQAAPSPRRGAPGPLRTCFPHQQRRHCPLGRSAGLNPVSVRRLSAANLFRYSPVQTLQRKAPCPLHPHPTRRHPHLRTNLRQPQPDRRRLRLRPRQLRPRQPHPPQCTQHYIRRARQVQPQLVRLHHLRTHPVRK
jgi:hypothetical protein